MTARFADTFTRLSQERNGAFVPFVNLCDPDEATSLRILKTLVAAGADALELGIPFSDPSADGPVIVASADRAIRNGATTEKCLKVIEAFRAENKTTPVSVMLYANLVFAPGVAAFFERAAKAGVDAVLIPDLPLVMRKADPVFAQEAARHGVKLVNLVPPKADAAFLEEAAEASDGYTYLLSRVGITGTDHAAGPPVEEVVRVLKENHAAPLLLGFGISKPSDVTRAMAAGVAGVIVGSAIVRIINEHLDRTEAMLAALTDYVRTMKAATVGALR